MSGFPWLTAILLLPVAGALVLQVIPSRARDAIKGVTVTAAAAEAVLVGMIVYGVATGPATGGPLPMHDVETASWIPAIGASYHLGVDGVSAWILALNAGVFLLGALVVPRLSTERLKLFCGLMLLTEAATTGVLISLDLLLFYLFWEGMLIPLYFLLAFYGNENRGRATLKFVIYTV
ncbi:MAG: proton-conducting transporter membrane subunit, partial [Candidatus Dormibacteria bacterium]